MKSSLEMKRRFAVNTRISQRFLRTPKAGEYLSLSSRTLEKHRTSGTGPGYCKLGGRVVYDLGRPVPVGGQRTARFDL